MVSNVYCNGAELVIESRIIVNTPHGRLFRNAPLIRLRMDSPSSIKADVNARIRQYCAVLYSTQKRVENSHQIHLTFRSTLVRTRVTDDEEPGEEALRLLMFRYDEWMSRSVKFVAEDARLYSHSPNVWSDLIPIRQDTEVYLSRLSLDDLTTQPWEICSEATPGRAVIEVRPPNLLW